MYAHHPQLALTITVSPDHSHGGQTGNYKWDDSGNLIAATITLGSRIDQCYPSADFYPVLNSLAVLESSHMDSANILAAAKIAHEFGHVNLTAMTDEALYRLQNQLMPVYNTILLRNGYNTRDPRLIELAQEMSGTSEEISRDREYWAEANAMLYLRDRITEKGLQRSLFRRINENVKSCDKSYAQRFLQIAQSQSRHQAIAARILLKGDEILH